MAASTQVQLVIREGETSVGDTNEDRWALGMQALAELYKMTAESLAKSERIARRLAREYPQWARGHMLLGSAIYHQILMGFQPATAERKDEAMREVRQAVMLDPKDEYNLVHLAVVLMDFTGDTGEAMVVLRRALDINPNFSLGYGLIGDTYLALDQPDEAIRNAEIAIRLNPRDPTNFFRFDTLALACLQKGDDDKALHWASQIVALKPDYWSGYAVTAAVLAGRGELDHARRSAEALKTCWPGVSISAINATVTWNDSPWRNRYFENLIAAGIPE